jgi:hypothetical protein
MNNKTGQKKHFAKNTRKDMFETCPFSKKQIFYYKQNKANV